MDKEKLKKVYDALIAFNAETLSYPQKTYLFSDANFTKKKTFDEFLTMMSIPINQGNFWDLFHVLYGENENGPILKSTKDEFIKTINPPQLNSIEDLRNYLNKDEILNTLNDAQKRFLQSTNNSTMTLDEFKRKLMDLNDRTKFLDLFKNIGESLMGAYETFKSKVNEWIGQLSQSQPTQWKQVNYTGEDLVNNRAVVKKFMKGDIVNKIQKYLISAGYKNVSKNEQPDGFFGRRTKARVVEFQKANNLVDDGIVGQKTWLALVKADETKNQLQSQQSQQQPQSQQPQAQQPQIQQPQSSRLTPEELKNLGFELYSRTIDPNKL
jgi:hypothetical protein